ncbi:MAG: hypothetical protein K0B09_13550 [Bacteroidales bacterium]|nr:hypothetical protein [Bacteroidales bacterium]
MAYAKQGLLGEFKGRLGNTVIYEVYGKTRIRLKPSVKPPPATGAKKQAQEDFKLVMSLMQATKAFVRIGFYDQAEGRSAFHEGLSFNLNSYRQAENKDIGAWLQLSNGQRAGAQNLAIQREGKKAIVSWGAPEPGKVAAGDDAVLLLALNTCNFDCNWVLSKYQRSQQQAEIILPPLKEDEECLVFVAFRKQLQVKKDIRNISASQVV